jgi:hypothetical protein
MAAVVAVLAALAVALLAALVLASVLGRVRAARVVREAQQAVAMGLRSIRSIPAQEMPCTNPNGRS